MRTKNYSTLGIDIGSVSIAAVLLDQNGTVTYRNYQHHNGNIHAVLDKMLDKLPARTVSSFGVISEKGREFFTSGIEVNEQVAIIAGVKQAMPDVRSIITIGGETFGLILFDKKGQYKKYIGNSACAAGTGSFLDQQASRLGLSGSPELSELAAGYQGAPPKIATRCAVFAKTDLAHIQQQGYSLPAIAAGLCRGIAQNIHDTLFHGVEVFSPVVVVGGVSKNRKVVQHLEEILKIPLKTIPEGEYPGAIGAGLIAAEKQPEHDGLEPLAISDLLLQRSAHRKYFYPPLSQTKSPIPDFSGWKTLYINDVEVDIYEKLDRGMNTACYLGIDVGSTSTKAALMTQNNTVLAGLYTRTSSQPITAVQRLTRTLQHLEENFAVTFRIIGAGTTGSGRKFIQRVARAEFAVDEISAHARAAFHLNPLVDTIIEIGGQDAKFTVMNNGNVTFSVMNYVCAAGTGSFIEEQAKKLGIQLKDYALQSIDVPAPMISDRCTVFMERDLNHMLSIGYSREELLAAALHSVRDNYLSKVAHINKIGNHIAFQGATAKNHALVRAFEYKLHKPIYVSKYCHLTGALGACLKMADAGIMLESGFRMDFHQEEVVVDEYICNYCNNHCKIKSIEIEGETLGWGYLCGRDERDTGYRKKADQGFDLLRNHRKVFNIPDKDLPNNGGRDVNLFQEFQQGGIRAVIRRSDLSLSRLLNRIQFNALEMRNELFSSGIVTRNQDKQQIAPISVGLPSTLNMHEYLPLWELFFKRLGFSTIVTSADSSRIASGKQISSADYCVPLMDFHGHMKDIASRANFIFYPQLLEAVSEKGSKVYCYYSSYAVPIIRNIPALDLGKRLIAPVLNLNDTGGTISRIYRALPEAMREKTTYNSVEDAFQVAWDWFQERKANLQALFHSQAGVSNDIGVVLMGRPYLVLHHSLNKKIPDRLADMGIQSFYMDMIPVDEEKLEVARDFLRLNHWHYGNSIIRAAETVAQTPGLFPVYLTAFKCSPDSFIISYFKEIMNYYGKPYIILQIDEHEAGEGYETRIEAAVETFRNFTGKKRRAKKPAVMLKHAFENKTYLLPGYDHLSAHLIQGAFVNSGINALCIEETPDIIQRSLRVNDGQCLPVSILALGVQHTIEKHGLDPEQVALFCNTEAQVSCNLPQYPVMIKKMLEQLGGGMEKVDLLVSRFLPTNFSVEFMYEIYMAYLLSGLVQKITCKIRPRENKPGMTDYVYQKASKSLFDCFANGHSKEETFQAIVHDFLAVNVHNRTLPCVGIVGDLYVRDNAVFNQNLIKKIEKEGAEAVTVPFVDAINLIADKHFKYQWSGGHYIDLVRDKVAYNTLHLFSKKVTGIAKPILNNGFIGLKNNSMNYLKKYGFTIRHGGETAENLLKVFYLYENCPDLRFIVNVNPIFCCPGLISEAIYKKLENDLGIPIVSITYDGTTADKNRVLKPYVHFLK